MSVIFQATLKCDQCDVQTTVNVEILNTRDRVPVLDTALPLDWSAEDNADGEEEHFCDACTEYRR